MLILRYQVDSGDMMPKQAAELVHKPSMFVSFALRQLLADGYIRV